MKDLGNIDCSYLLSRWIVQRKKTFYLCNTLWMHETVLLLTWHVQLHMVAALILLKCLLPWDTFLPHLL